MIAGIFEKMDDYNKFYEQLNGFLKTGVHEDPANRAKIDDFLRSRTSKSSEDRSASRSKRTT